jgi:hypothetical protein
MKWSRPNNPEFLANGIHEQFAGGWKSVFVIMAPPIRNKTSWGAVAPPIRNKISWGAVAPPIRNKISWGAVLLF